MTLTKAIEALRKYAIATNAYDMRLAYDEKTEAIAALPAEPKSEEEIATKIRDILIENVDDSSSVLNVVTYDIIRALKAADCLYVKED